MVIATRLGSPGPRGGKVIPNIGTLMLPTEEVIHVIRMHPNDPENNDPDRHNGVWPTGVMIQHPKSQEVPRGWRQVNVNEEARALWEVLSKSMKK